jgi:hypothetical protein
MELARCQIFYNFYFLPAELSKLNNNNNELDITHITKSKRERERKQYGTYKKFSNKEKTTPVRENFTSNNE